MIYYHLIFAEITYSNTDIINYWIINFSNENFLDFERDFPYFFSHRKFAKYEHNQRNEQVHNLSILIIAYIKMLLTFFCFKRMKWHFVLFSALRMSVSHFSRMQILYNYHKKRWDEITRKVIPKKDESLPPHFKCSRELHRAFKMPMKTKQNICFRLVWCAWCRHIRMQKTLCCTVF